MLGLSDSSAASLRVAADAVREVAHRLHYHARRVARLEAARFATSATARRPPSSRGGVLADLRERVAAARRARAREVTTRFAAEARTARARPRGGYSGRRHAQIIAQARAALSAMRRPLSPRRRTAVLPPPVRQLSLRTSDAFLRARSVLRAQVCVRHAGLAKHLLRKLKSVRCAQAEDGALYATRAVTHRAGPGVLTSGRGGGRSQRSS